MKKYNIITICGPTAGGKTKLAVQLGLEYKYRAFYLKGEITFDEMKDSLNTSIN